MKKRIVLCAAAALILCQFAACEKAEPERLTEPPATTAPAAQTTSGAAQTSQTETTVPPETQATTAPAEERQDPAAELAGEYVCDRCSITVAVAENGTLTFSVAWNGSLNELGVWEMHGAYDAETGTVDYSDCESYVLSDDEDGTQIRTDCYENGAGRFIFRDGTLLWEDEQEHMADNMIFERR